MDEKIHILVVGNGSREEQRAVEDIFRGSDHYEALAAGVHLGAETPVEQHHIDWADKIFVLSEREDNHLTLLTHQFTIEAKEIHDLGVSEGHASDARGFAELLKAKLARYLEVE